MPVWPSYLPPPLLEGYVREGEDVVIRTEVETGPLITRPRTRRPRPRVRAEWLLEIDPADRWQQWWETEARYGAEPFIWYEPLRGRPGRWQAIGPETWRMVAPRHRVLSLELQALEEWWPGWLAGTGRTIRIWDPRAGTTVREDITGPRLARLNWPVGQWIDRLGGAVLAAPENTRRPTLLSDATTPPHLWTDGDDRMDLASPAIDLAAFAFVVAASLDPTSGGYSRVLAALPASGDDWNNSAGIVLTSDDGTDIHVLSGAGYSLSYDTAAQLGTIAVVAIGSGTTGELRVNDVVRASQTGLSASGTTTGPLRLAAGQIGGAPSSYGKRRYFGVAVISGYVPTGVERTMLSRWAMAMAGRDPFD